MEDLYRRLLRITLMLIGSYLSLIITIKNTNDITNENFVNTVLLVVVVFMVIDNYIPRVNISTDTKTFQGAYDVQVNTL